MEDKGKKAVPEAPSGGVANVPAVDGARSLPPPPPKREEKLADAVRQAPPRHPKASGEPIIAPSPAPRDAGERGEGVEGGVVGGVVGGVLGGVMGSGGSASEQAEAEPPSAKVVASEAPPAYVKGPVPASASADARFRNGAEEKSAACESPWSVPSPAGWTLRSAAPAAAGESLVRLATRLGGRAERLPALPGSWRLTVPRDRWIDLAEALRGLGVA
jgi:hypothetical protein